MLGKENRQTSFFDTDFVCAHLIDKKSFYAKMRKFADRIITDDEFYLNVTFSKDKYFTKILICAIIEVILKLKNSLIRR